MKLNIGRIFETSKIINTKAGAETQDGWAFLADMSEQVIRAFGNQMSFGDNFDCIVSDVEIPHDTEQIVNTGGKIPFHIFPTRVTTGTELITWSAFGWRVNDQGETVVKISYGNSTDAQTVRLVIIFS